MIDVLFVEDQPVVSEPTAEKMARDGRIRAIKVCNTADKALKALRDEPDRWGLILLDLDVPGALGLSLAKEILDMGKASITCILTGTDKPEYVAKIKKDGFRGYILKATALEELELNISRAIAGESVFPPADLRKSAGDMPRLTQRQVECLHLVQEGKSSKEIGRLVGLSPLTVDYHIKSAANALGASSRSHAVTKAIQLGLMSMNANGE